MGWPVSINSIQLKIELVYVDDQKAPYRGMLMSHMVADTQAELYEMALAIGVPDKYLQYPNTRKEHFDICQQKRLLAIKNGAVPVDRRRLINIIKAKAIQPP